MDSNTSTPMTDRKYVGPVLQGAFEQRRLARKANKEREAMSEYKPTVGQPVHVHLSRDYAQNLGATQYDDGPMAATVSHVHNPGTINVSALDHQGKQFTIRCLSFIPPGYEAFDLPLNYACLPPGEEAEVEEEQDLVPMPCPFCAGVYDGFSIVDLGVAVRVQHPCGARGPWRVTQREAIQAWNEEAHKYRHDYADQPEEPQPELEIPEVLHPPKGWTGPPARHLEVVEFPDDEMLMRCRVSDHSGFTVADARGKTVHECIRELQKQICSIPKSPWTKKEPEEECNEPDRDYGPPTQHGGEEYHEQKEYGMPQLDFYLDEGEAVTYLRSVPVRSLAEVPHEGWLVDLGLSDTYRVSDVKIQYLSTPLCAEVFLDEREKEPTTTPQEDWPEAALSNERWIYQPSTPQDKWNRIVDLMEDLVIDLMGRKLYEPAKVILEFFDSFVSGWNFQGIHLPGKEDEQ